jgi:hypothetical protein
MQPRGDHGGHRDSFSLSAKPDDLKPARIAGCDKRPNHRASSAFSAILG